MENETNAAPAGDGANTVERNEQPTALSLHDAGGLLAEWSDEPETEQATEQPSEAPAEAEAGQEEAAPEQEAAPAEEAEPEATADPDECVHGNARTRLRDGTVVPVSELKKGYDELKEYRAREAQLTAEQQRIQAERTQIAQQKKLFEHVLPIAQQVLQQKLPQPPNPQLAKDDPIEHYQQMVTYQAEMARFNQLRHADQARIAQAQQAQAAQVQQHLAQAREKLVELLPELKTPEGKKSFETDYVKFGTEAYGFSQAELAQVYDPRLMVLVKDAVQWRKHQEKLKAAKPVVAEKAKAAVPVATPARRAAPSEQEAKAREEQFQRLRARGGRIEDAARLLADFD